MLYFLNLKGYEMYLYGLARFKPFANQNSSPCPPPFNVGGCQERRSTILCFNIVTGAWGWFYCKVLIVFNKFVQNCSMKSRLTHPNETAIIAQHSYNFHLQHTVATGACKDFHVARFAKFKHINQRYLTSLNHTAMPARGGGGTVKAN